MKRSAFLSAFVWSFVFCTAASAAIVAEPVEYRDGDVNLKGYIAYDDAAEDKRPGILVIHEWKGPGTYTERRARQLAELGYVAFAADMYGAEVRPQTHEEAAKVSGVYRKDRALMRARAKAGLDVLKEHPLVDAGRLGAIGYCFGGTAVLEMARAGHDLKGVVSFHGGLDAPRPAEPGAVKAEVLVLTGEKDPHAKPEAIEAFRKEMDAAGADYRVVAYPDAVHGFTVEEAGDDASTGVAYNADADKRSWEDMKAFFESVFRL